MKNLFKFIAFAGLLLTFVGCDKDDSDSTPKELYSIALERYYVSVDAGTSDFSNITTVVDPYLNKDFSSEQEVLAAYNEILSKTRDAEYSAPRSSYVKLYIIKYVLSKDGNKYESDPTYKSLAHIWDGDGSRDIVDDNGIYWNL